MNNKVKRILAVILTCLILLSSASTAAFAASDNGGKEEVVYIVTDSAGKVDSVNVVNIFGKGDVTDYGDYSSVKLMTSREAINFADGKVTFFTDSDRVYYQGKMDNAEIPWNISLSYVIDGKEYTADEAAGKSGKLEMHFKVTKNDKCKGNFYDSYALQAAIVLDTEKCRNITADGATEANAGSNKQLTYTILPGKGIDTVITADVTDFEMDSVSINGVRMSLSVNIDDSMLDSELSTLTDAVASLDDGAGELADGTKELYDSVSGKLTDGVDKLADSLSKLADGTSTLNDGAQQFAQGTASLSSGAGDLSKGIAQLNDGIKKAQDGLTQLNNNSYTLTSGSAQVLGALGTIQSKLSNVSASTDQLTALTSGSAQISEALNTMSESVTKLQASLSATAFEAVMKQNGLDVATVKAANESTIKTLTAQITELTTNIEKMKKAGADTAELEASAAQLTKTVELITGNSAVIDGAEKYIDGVGANVALLAQGMETLKTSYAQLDAGINSLASQLGNMLYSLSELKGGIDTLTASYSQIDSGIGSYTGGVYTLLTAFDELVAGSQTVLEGSEKLSDGAAELNEKYSQLASGVSELYSSAGLMKDGGTELKDGFSTLTDGVKKLDDGMTSLKDGTAEFRSKTDSLGDTVSEKIKDMLSEITGSDAETESFTDSRNTDVESVQFVIKTGAVAVPEAAAAKTEKAETLSFWQKLVNLFKKDN